MKIKKPKRIMSLFLAALMCVTSLVGMGTTAYAAEETDDVYLISFPRDGDSNYNAEWGHGSHTFMNFDRGFFVKEPSAAHFVGSKSYSIRNLPASGSGKFPV